MARKVPTLSSQVTDILSLERNNQIFSVSGQVTSIIARSLKQKFNRNVSIYTLSTTLGLMESKGLIVREKNNTRTFVIKLITPKKSIETIDVMDLTSEKSMVHFLLHQNQMLVSMIKDLVQKDGIVN
jgi:poly(3-hydroxyalkanoate) synthetase